MTISLHHSRLPYQRLVCIHCRLTQGLDGHTRLCGNISNTALDKVRSEMNSAGIFSVVSDFDPLLPAARQAHPLNREFNVADYGLPFTLIVSDYVSDFNPSHLSAVFDLDVKKVCFVPSWISAATPAQR